MRFTPEDQFEQQPLVSRDRKRVLIYSGRIDNRRALIASLKIPISESKVMPDSVLVMRAYERWGENCVQEMIGNFAFALWNVFTQRFFCSLPHW